MHHRAPFVNRFLLFFQKKPAGAARLTPPCPLFDPRAVAPLRAVGPDDARQRAGDQQEDDHEPRQLCRADEEVEDAPGDAEDQPTDAADALVARGPGAVAELLRDPLHADQAEQPVKDVDDSEKQYDVVHEDTSSLSLDRAVRKQTASPRA